MAIQPQKTPLFGHPPAKSSRSYVNRRRQNPQICKAQALNDKRAPMRRAESFLVAGRDLRRRQPSH